MTPMNYVYVVFGLGLLIAELIAVRAHDHERKPTISSIAISWMKRNPWHRWFVVGFLLWLTYHLAFQEF